MALGAPDRVNIPHAFQCCSTTKVAIVTPATIRSNCDHSNVIPNVNPLFNFSKAYAIEL